mmetsp:Transcript_14144/g.47926  ORF Transcript_14144/g.47926 Transcript_14144/m.47926 type:complete len:202 (+) Transcript_14144:176-781(+)
MWTRRPGSHVTPGRTWDSRVTRRLPGAPCSRLRTSLNAARPAWLTTRHAGSLRARARSSGTRPSRTGPRGAASRRWHATRGPFAPSRGVSPSTFTGTCGTNAGCGTRRRPTHQPWAAGARTLPSFGLRSVSTGRGRLARTSGPGRCPSGPRGRRACSCRREQRSSRRNPTSTGCSASGIRLVPPKKRPSRLLARGAIRSRW